MISGLIFVGVAVVMTIFRSSIANFFAWMHRNAPGGGGEAYAVRSRPKYVARTAFLIFLTGIWLILHSAGWM